MRDWETWAAIAFPVWLFTSFALILLFPEPWVGGAMLLIVAGPLLICFVAFMLFLAAAQLYLMTWLPLAALGSWLRRRIKSR